jgi:two-component system response regulator DesR
MTDFQQTQSPAIRLTGLTKRFGTLTAVSDVDLTIQPGGNEALEATRSSNADVALLDVEMPGLDGIGAARLLRTQFPSCRALIVTTFGRAGYVRLALEAGAAGFVVKDTPSSQLADAVRRVAAGG